MNATTHNATAAARHLASESGLDIDKIAGTGRGGVATATDVKRVLAMAEAGNSNTPIIETPAFDQSDSSTWIDPAHGLTMDAWRLAGDLARKGDLAQAAGQDAAEDVLLKAARVFMIGVNRCSVHWNAEKDGIPDVIKDAWIKGLKTNMSGAYVGTKLVATDTVKQYESRVTWCMKRGITPFVTKLSIPCVRYLPPDSQHKIRKVIEHTDLTVNSINAIKSGYWVEGSAKKAGLWAPGFSEFVSDPEKCKAKIEARCRDGAKDTGGGATSDDGPDETSEMLKYLTEGERTMFRQVADLIRMLDKFGDREFADEILKSAFGELQARLHEMEKTRKTA